MRRLFRALGLVCVAGWCVRAPDPAAADSLAIQEMALTEGEVSWNGKAQWIPGEQVWVRAVLGGLARDADGQISVHQSLELRDAQGRTIAAAADLLKLDRAVPAELSSIELINHFRVPEGLSAGTYLVHVRCEDGVAGTAIHGELPLVVAEGPQAGLRLTRFTLVPESVGGEVARAEARVVGYRTDAQGRYWIEADVVVGDATGKLALRWDRVLEQHQRSEPIGLPLKLSLRLELPEHYVPGDYRLELTIRDRLAGSEVVHSATWTKR
jgi:hypothetical protein